MCQGVLGSCFFHASDQLLYARARAFVCALAFLCFSILVFHISFPLYIFCSFYAFIFVFLPWSLYLFFILCLYFKSFLILHVLSLCLLIFFVPSESPRHALDLTSGPGMAASSAVAPFAAVAGLQLAPRPEATRESRSRTEILHYITGFKQTSSLI